MKQLIIVIGFLVIAAACSTQRGFVQVKGNNELISEDSLSYELETFDLRFESWYLLQKSPALYRSQSYYESWNKIYVNAWNINSISARGNSFFEPIVGYDPTVDYGFELNHQLFYYFQYVEQVLKIKIMPGGPNAVI